MLAVAALGQALIFALSGSVALLADLIHNFGDALTRSRWGLRSSCARRHRVKRFDFWVAAVAVIAVLSAGVLAGFFIGIALSLVWFVYVATTPACLSSAASPAPRCSAT